MTFTRGLIPVGLLRRLKDICENLEKMDCIFNDYVFVVLVSRLLFSFQFIIVGIP